MTVDQNKRGKIQFSLGAIEATIPDIKKLVSEGKVESVTHEGLFTIDCSSLATSQVSRVVISEWTVIFHLRQQGRRIS